jgi:hypothetical protein
MIAAKLRDSSGCPRSSHSALQPVSLTTCLIAVFIACRSVSRSRAGLFGNRARPGGGPERASSVYF